METGQDGISAFIIAGGKSRRFGADKALFEYRGRPLIEHVIEAIRPVTGRIAIAADDGGRFRYLGLPCYPDAIPGAGAFGGVYTALLRSETERVFVAACDMPWLDTGLIRFIVSVSEGYDVTIPRPNGRFEPLHAVYSGACTAHMRDSLERGGRRIISFFENVSIRTVTDEEISRFGDPDRIFRNINYQEDTGD